MRPNVEKQKARLQYKLGRYSWWHSFGGQRCWCRSCRSHLEKVIPFPLRADLEYKTTWRAHQPWSKDMWRSNRTTERLAAQEFCSDTLTPSSWDIWTSTLGPLTWWRWWRFPQNLVLFWKTFSSYAYMVYPSLSVYARPPSIQTLTIGCYDLKEPRWAEKPRSHTKWPQRFHKSQASCNWTQNISDFFMASRMDWWMRKQISAIKNYKTWRCPGKSWPSDGTPVHDRRPTGAANKKCRCCQGLGHFQTFSVEVNPS